MMVTSDVGESPETRVFRVRHLLDLNHRSKKTGLDKEVIVWVTKDTPIPGKRWLLDMGYYLIVFGLTSLVHLH